MPLSINYWPDDIYSGVLGISLLENKDFVVSWLTNWIWLRSKKTSGWQHIHVPQIHWLRKVSVVCREWTRCVKKMNYLLEEDEQPEPSGWNIFMIHRSLCWTTSRFCRDVAGYSMFPRCCASCHSLNMSSAYRFPMSILWRTLSTWWALPSKHFRNSTFYFVHFNICWCF